MCDLIVTNGRAGDESSCCNQKCPSTLRLSGSQALRLARGALTLCRADGADGAAAGLRCEITNATLLVNVNWVCARKGAATGTRLVGGWLCCGKGLLLQTVYSTPRTAPQRQQENYWPGRSADSVTWLGVERNDGRCRNGWLLAFCVQSQQMTVLRLRACLGGKAHKFEVGRATGQCCPGVCSVGVLAAAETGKAGQTTLEGKTNPPAHAELARRKEDGKGGPRKRSTKL